MVEVDPAEPTSPATQEGALDGFRRRRRAFFDELQRWQNLVSAMIALGAAAWAWQYTQWQIDVAQRQLATAQTQAAAAQVQTAIGRAEVLKRRLSELQSIRARVEMLASEAETYVDPTRDRRTALLNRAVIDLFDLDRGQGRLAREKKVLDTIEELAQMLVPMSRSSAVETVLELSNILSSLSDLKRVADRNAKRWVEENSKKTNPGPEPPPPYGSAELIAGMKPAFHKATTALNAEIEAIGVRVRELDAVIR